MPAVIIEFSLAQDALHDISVRAQQCLIAIDVYEDQLKKVGDAIPGLLSMAVDTKEQHMNWTSLKTPKELIDYQRRSKQFVLLNGWNLAICLLDNFMRLLASKYYDLKVPETSDGKPDETWFSPDAFETVTGVNIKMFKRADTVDEIRRIANGVRMFKKTNAITSADFFEGLQCIGEYIYELATRATERAIDKAKREQEQRDSSGGGRRPKDGPGSEPDDFDTIE